LKILKCTVRPSHVVIEAAVEVQYIELIFELASLQACIGG